MHDSGVGSFSFPEITVGDWLIQTKNGTNWFCHKSDTPTPTTRNLKVLLISSLGKGAPSLCFVEIEESENWQF